ncbi:ELM1/GtrOC1 family putative glycosyltransferase [Thiogranum longum]|uniref:ELM1/GtrOC1 family putative glycosyltransferase n=1 Tax=Thiogranum longum TaxID=1537524 RepID=UPI0014029E6C|nr:ELM1/GtrOC1 family putative glycosyltransferase [Thiogranum longum]
MSERKRVWLLSDGQPGHDSRSQGIVHALAEVMPLDVQVVELKMRMGLARNALRYLLNHTHGPLPPGLLKLFYRMNSLPEGQCDLIVSAGGKTSFANAWLARRSGAKNIFAGTLRRLQARQFSVVMTLEPVPGANNNLVVPLLPTTIDLKSVAEQGECLRKELAGDGRRYWLMLLGGKGAGYGYRQRDWMYIARIMNRLADRHGIRWLLATSRRTGAVGEQMLRRYINTDCLARACWSESGEKFQAQACLGASDQVFVTEDSMTMLTEAMSAQRPVYSLRPEHALPDNRYEQALLNYVDAGRLCRLSLAELVERPELFDERRYRPEHLPDSQLGKDLVCRLGWSVN